MVVDKLVKCHQCQQGASIGIIARDSISIAKDNDLVEMASDCIGRHLLGSATKCSDFYLYIVHRDRWLDLLNLDLIWVRDNFNDSFWAEELV
ncbi:unannotated protein [freshwater metagenome]|uniref:Unannotated protein n=1 Tax=freshwater metagenome TaxID=449393 RepID=A0A6J6PLM0_9ZZZZ